MWDFTQLNGYCDRISQFRKILHMIRRTIDFAFIIYNIQMLYIKCVSLMVEHSATDTKVRVRVLYTLNINKYKYLE